MAAEGKRMAFTPCLFHKCEGRAADSKMTQGIVCTAEPMVQTVSKETQGGKDRDGA